MPTAVPLFITLLYHIVKAAFVLLYQIPNGIVSEVFTHDPVQVFPTLTSN